MKFIAYFDFLGYKDFILNNDSDFIYIRVNHIIRDIEMALSNGKLKKTKRGSIIADREDSKINGINISDSVIFWSNSDYLEDLEEILSVAYYFNWKENLFNFPVRGAIIYDDLQLFKYSDNNKFGANYYIDALVGKGIVNSYLLAENLNLAGCVIDNSVINKLVSFDIEIEDFLNPYALKYNVPYKNPNNHINNEYILKLIKGQLDEFSYNNIVEDINRVFSKDNKYPEKARAMELMHNTIEYLKVFMKSR